MKRFFPALVALTLLAVTTISQATVTSGLIGWWIFNDPSSSVYAQDSSGHGHPGTLTSTAYFTPDSLRTQVLDVAGAPGEVDYGIPFSPFSGTISVWVKPTLAVTGDVIRQDTTALPGTSGTYYVYDLRVSATGKPSAIIGNPNFKAGQKDPQIVVTGKASVKLNQWTHLTMRWDSSAGVLSLFINGKLAGSATYTPLTGLGLPYDGTSPMKVAAAIWDFNNGYLEYVGELSDFRFYGRALADTEIYQIYNGQ